MLPLVLIGGESCEEVVTWGSCRRDRRICRGAGFRNAAGEFEGAFNEHAFLVAPESLIFSHFPEDANWQKLAEPLSREAFEGLFEAIAIMAGRQIARRRASASSG